MSATPPQADTWCTVTQRGGRLLVSWGADEAPTFDAIRLDFRAVFPRRRDAAWLPDERCWSVPLCELRRLEAWCVGWFPNCLEWETASGQEAAAAGATAALAEAYATLCLTPQAPPELVSAARRILSKDAHPDRGGDELTMRRLNHAHDLIVARRGAESAHGSMRREGS